MQKPFCACDSYPKQCLGKLVNLIEKRSGKADKHLIEKAFLFARAAHKNQFRESKKPYFSHPMETAAILADMGMGSVTISAALLHDVLEDTETKKVDFKAVFGKELLLLVEGVTKLSLITRESRQTKSLHNLHNLLFATTKDPRVILIKLADKLHNLRTLQHLPPKDRKRIASEALMIHVPIAHKIGLEELAVEMEDFAFSYAEPETFKMLEAELKEPRASKNKEINLMIAILKKRLPKTSFYKKQRSVYGIYTKMRHTGKILDELNDCIILNVVAENRQQCYAALGVIHSFFPPLPHKVKDFIAAPKPSLYRVLQTTVFGPKKKPVKVRITTPCMDAINRRGVVAYRRLVGGKMSEHMQQSLSKLGLLLSNGEGKPYFINALRLDFLTIPIYVFTAKGKLVELPRNSTVLDFAFATKKSKAHFLIRANVNGKKASFGHRLDSGQVVELFFGKKKRLNASWLRYTNSLIFKEAIKAHLKGKKKKSK